ncbi:MAG: hypothetical protein JNM22_23600 [Saprospiraceae bacterium]|nr:hypothetical protein [Saprospiraceae bacterium]
MGIKLRTQHLWISSDIARTVFGDQDKVYTVYYPQLHALLLAPMDDEIFPTIHKGGLQMLKTRNLEGDKTISLQEIIIDNDLDDSDRELLYMHQPGVRMLHVTL